MNFKEIKKLIEILDKSTLTEVNIEDTRGRVTLKEEKETEVIAPQISRMSVEAAAMPMPQAQSTNGNKTEAPKPTSDNRKTINAPTVGAFYKSPSPDEEAYVQVGDTVSNEATVCILEAVKLFDEIQTEISGEIAEILIEDGQVVRYGQPLFKVK